MRFRMRRSSGDAQCRTAGRGVRRRVSPAGVRRGVQILEEVIKFRWGALPDEQREGIRNYVSNLIIKLSSDEAAFRRERVFLNKLNIILVQVRRARAAAHPARHQRTVRTCAAWWSK